MARNKLSPAEAGTDIQIADTTPPAIAAQEIALHEHQQTLGDLFGIPPNASPDELLDIGTHALNASTAWQARAGAAFRECRNVATRDEGGFRALLAERGIDRTAAYRAIQIADYLAALPLQQARRIMHVQPTKLLELAKADPEVVSDLLEEGALDGDTPLSVRDLRAALREARAEIEAKDTQADKRQRAIDKLQQQLDKAKGDRKRATPDEVTEELRSRAARAALQARGDIGAEGEDVDSLYGRFAELREHAIDAGGPDGIGDEHDAFMGGLIGELMVELRRVRDAFGLPIINDYGAPGWVEGA